MALDNVRIIFIPLAVENPDAPLSGVFARGIPLTLVEKLDGLDGMVARFYPLVAEAKGRRAWMVYTDTFTNEAAAKFSVGDFRHTHIAAGSISLNSRIEISYKIYKTGKKKPVYSTDAAVEKKDFLAFLGTLGCDIYSKLGGESSVDVIKHMSNFGTTSISAFGSYLSGRNASMAVYYDLTVDHPENSFDGYLAALDEDPIFIEASRHLSALAMEFVMKKDMPAGAAIEALHEAAKSAADPQPIYGALGVAMQNTGKPEEAVKYYKKAIEMDPSCEFVPRLREDLGSLLMSRGDMAGAAEELEAARSAGVETSGLMEKLAVVYASAGRIPEAVEIWEEILSTCPANPAALANLLRVAIAEGDDVKTLQLFEEGRKAEHPSWPLYRLYSSYLRERGERKKARETLLEFMNRTPEAEAPAWAHAICGRLCMETNEPAIARTHLEKAVSMAPLDEAGRVAKLLIFSMDHPDDLKKLTAAEQNAFTGDAAASIEPLKNLAAAYPELWSIHLALGTAYRRTGERDHALAELHLANKAAPEDIITLTSLGEIYADIGEFAYSLDYYEKAANADPANPLAQCNLAQAHLNAGNASAARTAVEKARQSAGEQEIVLRFIADIEKRLESWGG
jgi:Flp pilus assembly protein TadD